MHAVFDVTIRHAVASDLDALVWIGVAAFPYDPQWPYRYPLAAEFPEDHWKFSRNRYAEWLDAANAGDCAIVVAECPSLEDQCTRKVVGLSIWRLPRFDDIECNDKLKPPKANSIRRDANPLHMAAFRMGIGQAQEKYFDHIYGKNQLSLAQVATHPDYWRRGAATMMLSWGTSLSMCKRWPITLFAGPAAYGLYRKFGFKTAGMVSMSVVGEEEKIEFPGMTWEPYDAQQHQDAALEPLRLAVEFDPWSS